MPATVLLVRHATHDRPGPHLVGRDNTVALSPAGEQEAATLAAALSTVPLTRLLTSPARRCRQTAEALALPHALTPEPAAPWDELHFGDWRGRPFTDLSDDPQWTRFNAARATAVIPSGETIHAVADRVARALADLDTPGGGTVAVVTHADVIRTALCLALGLSPDLMLRFEVAPASVSTIRWDTPPTLLALNWRPQPPE